MREQAGLTLDQAAPRLDLTRSSLNRLETGTTLVNVHVVRSMMDLYDQYSADLLDTVRAARRRGWWHGYRVANPDYVGWETGAGHVLELAAARVPELLQTEDYTRALLADSVDIGAELAARRIRQRRLSEDASLVLSVVLDEAAVRNTVGGPDVMRAQLAHLVACSSWPAVTMRVLPADAGARVRVGGFRLLDFDHPDDLPVVYLESAVGELREEEAERVIAVRRAFDSISAAALSVEDSQTFVEQLTR
jgi:DNA-binding XRE family transcriptional regulator